MAAFGMLTLVATGACGPSRPPSRHTRSFEIKSLGERVRFLEQYISFKRHYRALEFDIDYHDNSGGLVPGPSDWDIALVAVVPAQELSQWTKDTTPVSLMPSMAPTFVNSKVDVSGINEWYESKQKVVGIDRARSIVVYRIWTY